MITQARGPLTVTPESAAATLPELFLDACTRQTVPGIVRVEADMTLPSGLLALCRAVSPRVRHYWRDRLGRSESVGLDTAATFTGMPHETAPAVVQLLAGATDSVRIYGGAAFAPASEGLAPGDAWGAFGPSWFVLPLVEVRTEDGETRIAVHGLMDGNHSPDDAARSARETLVAVAEACTACLDETREARAFHVAERMDAPEHLGWCAMVRRALEQIRRGEYAKVVLARETRFRLDADPDPFELVCRLSATAAHAYQFCFQPRAGCALVGASPERLYRRRGAMLQTEAVAGTRPRGASSEEDTALAQALLHSGKDRREHRFVADSVLAVLRGAGATITNADGIDVLPLRSCQHLYQRIEAALPSGVTDAHLLQLLHPSPAVGGFPTSEALRAIPSLEPFNRGWYAGPVGWLSRQSAEFAVAIRSGLLAGNEAVVLSGAGIVEGSVPEEEWREIETKMEAFLSALAGRP